MLVLVLQLDNLSINLKFRIRAVRAPVTVPGGFSHPVSMHKVNIRPIFEGLE